MKTLYATVGIVGCGAMGQGIAQIAAQAQSRIILFDVTPQLAENAKKQLIAQWEKLVAKGRLSSDKAGHLAELLHPAGSLSDLADCDLVIEAIVENLSVKQALLAQIEKVVSSRAVLVSNTSSLSITAIGAHLACPERFAGYHFFNPVPLMKVVEVIAGLKTSPAVCQQLSDYAHQMGHTPVLAQDTPGFIVNHAGRGYGTEDRKSVV